MDDLPTDYDAIVVGTGMTESVIAAAISRIGKSVLHLDPNDFYGDTWASFTLDGFKNWAEKKDRNDKTEKISENLESLVEDNEKLIILTNSSNVWNIQYKDHYNEKESLEDNKEAEVCDDKEVSNDDTLKEISQESTDNKLQDFKTIGRKFNLDLCPKLLFSRGLLVQLLISSNIARYAEFKSVNRVLTWRNNQLEQVPCSRADVFATKNVSVVQKRILVKILTLFSNYSENLNEFEGFEKKTFLEFLKYKKLPENLIHYILYAIAMGDNKTPCLVGVKACKTFLESLGRYGNTPFIFPMYGCGEIPQCFCRLCAVFGGIYCLQRGIEALIIKDNKCVGVISNKKRLNAKAVILSSTYVTKSSLLNDKEECISRGIFITDRSILSESNKSLTLLQFPPVPEIHENSVTVIELGSGTYTCPDNYFVVHMTTKMAKEASSDFKHVIESLFDGESNENNESNVDKPKILWRGTWNTAKGSKEFNDFSIENLKICCGVDSELDYDFSIIEAKKIFEELYPEEEFLPRAPDPEEIVLEHEEKTNEDSTNPDKNLCDGEQVNKEKSDYSDPVTIPESPICDINESNEKNDHSLDS